MPDLVSLTRWRDPVSDPPEFSARSVLVVHDTIGVTNRIAGEVVEHPERLSAWAEHLNPSSAVSLEDIETVLVVALQAAQKNDKRYENDPDNYLAAAVHLEAVSGAVARIRAALGGEDA